MRDLPITATSPATDQHANYLDLIAHYTAITRKQWTIERDAQHEWYRSDPRPEQRPTKTPWDYLILDTLDGIEYWLPNDETWFDIVAVDHTNQLAAFTGFCEMDDFEHEDSDYRYVLNIETGEICCRFEL